MTKKIWLSAVLTGIALGGVVASIMTALDWRLNPGGVFHDERGIQWAAVTETAVSWFLPTASTATAVAALVLYAGARRQ